MASVTYERVDKVYSGGTQAIFDFSLVESVSASAIQDILGCSSKTARDLQVEVARLEPWQVISRSQDRAEGS